MTLSRDGFFRSLAMGPILLALACSNPGKTVQSKPAEPFVATLNLRPVFVSLGAGTTQTFQAEFNLPEEGPAKRPSIGWRVLEPAGGAITSAGLYTAPAAPGTYHVQVRREDFPEVTALATVTVK